MARFTGKNVSCDWVGGNQYFYDKNGNEIFHVDGVNRALVIPAGSTLNAPGTDLESASTVAAAGSSQGTAAALASKTNAVTGADNTVSVVLPTAIIGEVVEVINTDSTHTLPVYPATGAAINSGSANAAFTLGPGKSARFAATSTTQWYAALASAGAPVIGVAAGYKVARGIVAVTNAASGIATVVTGLATVVACGATMADDPTITCESVTASIGDQAGSPAAGSIYVKGWKTFGGTPAAMTTTSVSVNWFAIGT